MKIHIVTLALDAMYFLPTQLATFSRLSLDWTWHICEGVAQNVKDTAWCREIPGRLSNDGTTQFLAGLMRHPRVRIYQKPLWPGKTAMMNAMLEQIKEPCLLLEVDADELWLPEQIEILEGLFDQHTERQWARFFCRYFVGPNLITVGENCYGNNPGEWLRAWRFTPGQKFKTHEPPVLEGISDTPETGFTRSQTREYGLVFDHWAYAYAHQLKFKSDYYGYKNAVWKWLGLQNYPGRFPVKLNQFFNWVDDRAQVIKLP